MRNETHRLAENMQSCSTAAGISVTRKIKNRFSNSLNLKQKDPTYRLYYGRGY